MVSHEILASVCCYLVVCTNTSYELYELCKVIFVLAVVSISKYQATGQCSYHSRAHRMRKEVQCHKHVIMHALLSEDRTQAVSNIMPNNELYPPPHPLLPQSLSSTIVFIFALNVRHVVNTKLLTYFHSIHHWFILLSG